MLYVIRECMDGVHAAVTIMNISRPPWVLIYTAVASMLPNWKLGLCSSLARIITPIRLKCGYIAADFDFVGVFLSILGCRADFNWSHASPICQEPALDNDRDLL